MSLSEERLAKIFYCPKSENFFYNYLDTLFVLGHYSLPASNAPSKTIKPTNWNFKYKLFMVVDGEERKPWRNTFKSEKRFPLCTLQTLPQAVSLLWTAMRGTAEEERWVFQCNAIERKYWKEFNLMQEAREDYEARRAREALELRRREQEDEAALLQEIEAVVAAGPKIESPPVWGRGTTG